MGIVAKRSAWACVERSLVQILVVVANIQTRTLKAEVEKGSLWTAVEHGSVGPERWSSAIQKKKKKKAEEVEGDCGQDWSFGIAIVGLSWPEMFRNTAAEGL